MGMSMADKVPPIREVCGAVAIDRVLESLSRGIPRTVRKDQKKKKQPWRCVQTLQAQ